MTPDRIEAALRSEIPAHEREFVARPLPATVMDARDALTRRRAPNSTLVMATAVAAVALVIVIGWVATQTIVPEGGLGVGDGATAPSSASATPAETPSAVLPACGPDDFTIASDPWDAGAGSRGTRVVLRVDDSTPACVLPAMWGAQVEDAEGRMLVRSTERTFAAHEATAGAMFDLEVYWSNWCGDPPSAPQLLLILDNVSVVVEPADGSGILVPPCMGSGEPSSLSVGELVPSAGPPIGG